jgi:hypothetical protein
MPEERPNLTSKNTAPVLPLKKRPEQYQRIVKPSSHSRFAFVAHPASVHLPP